MGKPWIYSLNLKKQITGIEPASPAWEAGVLPMNYICTTQSLYHIFLILQVFVFIFFIFHFYFIIKEIAQRKLPK